VDPTDDCRAGTLKPAALGSVPGFEGLKIGKSNQFRPVVDGDDVMTAELA
jgi:hypothetical protein